MSSASSKAIQDLLHTGTQITDYSSLVSVGLILVYDHMLTADLEWVYIWRRPKGHGSRLFLLVRYFSLLANTANIIADLSNFSPQASTQFERLMLLGLSIHLRRAEVFTSLTIPMRVSPTTEQLWKMEHSENNLTHLPERPHR
ncbi:hypothetical protein C8R43DRAFT_1124584 [Mycena crocata]|nr:hypothetical protein C8R43DRAFT_1124584 [Mycena crocata]